VAFKTSVCPEYESLLFRCKAFFDECQKTACDASNRTDAAYKQEISERLLEQYQRSYEKLIRHFDHCRTCQSAQRPWRRSFRHISP
jgi:hypothetical protein